MRSEFQKGLSSPKAVRSMLPDSEQIIREWLQHLDIQDSLIIPDMLPELSRLNLERKYCFALPQSIILKKIFLL